MPVDSASNQASHYCDSRNRNLPRRFSRLFTDARLTSPSRRISLFCSGWPRNCFSSLLFFEDTCRRTSGVGVPFQTLQVGPKFRSVLIAQITVFLQSLVDNLFQPRRKVWIEPNGRNRGFFEYAVEDYA